MTLSSQQEADLVLDGWNTARNGGWPGECPELDAERRAHWLNGFTAWHQRRELSRPVALEGGCVLRGLLRASEDAGRELADA